LIKLKYRGNKHVVRRDAIGEWKAGADALSAVCLPIVGGTVHRDVTRVC
jgi:hypothetical protein